MTEMAPEQPVPDDAPVDIERVAEIAASADLIDPDSVQEVGEAMDLKIAYEWDPETSLLVLKTSNGGAKLRLEFDTSIEEVYEQADILLAATPSMLNAVITQINSEDPK